MRKALPIGAWLLALVMLAGCDVGWQEFKRIQVGQSMPSRTRFVPTSQPDDHRLVWGDSLTLSLPAMSAQHAVTVQLNPDGTVRAKTYAAMVVGHWLLAGSMAVRRVVECQVPASRLSAAATSQPETVALSEIINAERVSYDWLPDTMTSSNNAAAMIGFAQVYLWSISMSYVQQIDDSDEFRGLATTGFDAVWANHRGSTIRLRNLGGGRFRCETTFHRIMDPFYLIPQFEFTHPTNRIMHTQTYRVR